jgi:elongation factor P
LQPAAIERVIRIGSKYFRCSCRICKPEVVVIATELAGFYRWVGFVKEISVKASDMRAGMAVTLDGNLYICVHATHVTPGNLRAFVQAKLKRLSDGAIIEKRLRSTEDIEHVYLDRRDMEYLYSDNTGHVLMDNKTYDQVIVSDELIGESIKFFRPNTPVTALLNEGKVVVLELPKVVELTVTETSPTSKGVTVTNQMKDAILETGLRTRVPPFIEVGELIRISTEDGSYLSRAK